MLDSEIDSEPKETAFLGLSDLLSDLLRAVFGHHLVERDVDLKIDALGNLSRHLVAKFLIAALIDQGRGGVDDILGQVVNETLTLLGFVPDLVVHKSAYFFARLLLARRNKSIIMKMNSPARVEIVRMRKKWEM